MSTNHRNERLRGISVPRAGGWAMVLLMMNVGLGCGSGGGGGRANNASNPNAGPADAAKIMTVEDGSTSSALDAAPVSGMRMGGIDPCEGVVCAAIDQCHEAGICDPASGTCSNPNKQDGTACDDGDACTQTDTCQSGQCTGSDPVVCPINDCGNPATCDPGTGICGSGAATSYTVTDVMARIPSAVSVAYHGISEFKQPILLNNRGQVAGDLIDQSPGVSPVCAGGIRGCKATFVWTPDVPNGTTGTPYVFDMGTRYASCPGGQGPHCGVAGINDAGQITVNRNDGGAYVYRCEPPSYGDSCATLVRIGLDLHNPLGSCQYMNGWASGINSSGRIVGFGGHCVGTVCEQSALGLTYEGPGRCQQVPPYGLVSGSYPSLIDSIYYTPPDPSGQRHPLDVGNPLPLAINDLGQTTGYSTLDLSSPATGYLTQGSRAVLYISGGVPCPYPANCGATEPNCSSLCYVTDPMFVGFSPAGLGINNHGQVVGIAVGLNRAPSFGFLYDNGQVTDITGLVQDPYPNAINNHGQVVGARGGVAFIWDRVRGLRNLEALVPPGSIPVSLGSATAINDHGQILTEQRYLLTPVCGP